jgi:hypothetical protein
VPDTDRTACRNTRRALARCILGQEQLAAKLDVQATTLARCHSRSTSRHRRLRSGGLEFMVAGGGRVAAAPTGGAAIPRTSAPVHRSISGDRQLLPRVCFMGVV